MIHTPDELVSDKDGHVTLPLSLLAEAGINPVITCWPTETATDGLVLRRHADAMSNLLERGTP
ncbi:hypothetical protein ACIQGZ_28030 [Streptomyces sp. NPDC092296]|uniref:hypothetical protein n=1 Tax=Streptomyces sp. NPDC092296 TaxID=3366012 RepID=UPI0037FFDAD8